MARVIEAVEEIVSLTNLIDDMENARNVKTFKTRENPIELYNDVEFRQKYRFSKAGVMFLDHLIGTSLTMDTRGKGLPSTLQILTALRYWGRNQIQDDAADIHGLSQQSVTIVCRRVARALLEKRFDYIKMPVSLSDQLKTMQKFEALAGFKTVIGAIDCTHIKIPKVMGPSGQFYINRKGFSSLNVQVVCDATLRINNIVAHWRGSTHDSRIFSESQLKERFEEGQIFHGRLLGDSGYACTPYLFTPVLNPSTPKEEAYNYAHIRTRNTIERCFGVWKSRFRCLQNGFRTSLENTKMYLVALAVLHNIAIELKEEAFTNEEDIEISQSQPVVPSTTYQNTMRGNAVRATFIQEHF